MWRWLAPVVLVAAAGAITAVVLATPAASGPRCDAIDYAAFRTRGSDVRGGPTARRVVDCHALDGRTRPEARRLLGAPSRARRSADRWIVGSGNDVLRLTYAADGRVRASAIERPRDEYAD